MPSVLALDLATSTGYAVVDDQGCRTVGSWRLDDGVATGKRAPPLDTRHVLLVQRLRRDVAELCERHRPDVVAVEREFGRGSGQRLLVSLYTAAQEAAYDAGLPCLGVRIGDWRRHVHGTAGLSTDEAKARALAVCASAGVDVPDADAAEAYCVARYVRDTVRIHPVTEPRRAA